MEPTIDVQQQPLGWMPLAFLHTFREGERRRAREQRREERSYTSTGESGVYPNSGVVKGTAEWERNHWQGTARPIDDRSVAATCCPSSQSNAGCSGYDCAGPTTDGAGESAGGKETSVGVVTSLLPRVSGSAKLAFYNLETESRGSKSSAAPLGGGEAGVGVDGWFGNLVAQMMGVWAWGGINGAHRSRTAWMDVVMQFVKKVNQFGDALFATISG